MWQEPSKRLNPAMGVLSVVALFSMFMSNEALSCEGRMAGADPMLTEFFDWCSAEDTLMDPLIVQGPEVVPYVLDVILNPDMPKRRYAIGALGNIGSRLALAPLRTILGNQEEPDYIRCTSLNAITQIDWEVGRSLANEFNTTAQPPISTGCLVRVSKSILTRSKEQWLTDSGIVRSLEDAERRKHY